MKDAIMGKRYEATLTFIGETRARSLNQAYRQKDYVPNVLSFPLTDSVGEVYISPAVAKREAKKFNLSVDGYIAFLFIHGLLHLKGLDHGDTMEKQERKYLKQFRIT
jgi:probable rRNA maturation factor